MVLYYTSGLVFFARQTESRDSNREDSMLSKVASMLVVFAIAVSYGEAVAAIADNKESSTFSTVAELFGLPLNDLSVSQLESRLNTMGLSSYPSYKQGVMAYSLGPEGILGVTNATIYSNRSGYIRQVLLSGVVESNEQRMNLGTLLEKKYGAPTEGFLNNGLGRSRWHFSDGTSIDFRNTTYDVSILYVDEQPKVATRSGQIEVEALSRQK